MIPSGTRLGPYEIVAPLGAGGMGEVYRARHATLGRDVAIKVLSASFGAHPDALGRFEREARAVAALSHPNILAIHDFGSADGVSYAVMELLEGESLRQTLGGGPLPLRRALDYAIQIARGLAAAHDKGIVHRDLKPENVFVTADERVKILDFGLARQDTPEAPATIAPTLHSPTEPGTVLGTVGYMAPEQVRGATVDWRADIFSFGALLYEMVTGHRAFQRETAAETMTAILREEPPDPSPPLRPAVDRIIRHCLEKKPEARFRSAHDLAFALDAAGGSSVSTQQLPAPAAARGAGRKALYTAAAVGVVAAAALAGVWTGRTVARSPAPAPADPPQFRRLTFERGRIMGARFVPDGHTIVYSAAWDGRPPRLFLTRLEFPGATAITAPNAVLFAVSPSAEMAVGVNPVIKTSDLATEATLARLPLLGGAAHSMLENVKYADWSASGELAVARGVGSDQRLEYPIGTVLYQTTGQIGGVRVSPDGNRVALIDWPVKGDDRGKVVVVERKGGASHSLPRTWESLRGVAWQPDGSGVIYSAASEGNDYSLWRAPADLGAEHRMFSGPGGLIVEDVARDGRALMKRYDRSMHIEGTVGGSERRIFSWLDISFARDISSDGKQILLTFVGRGASPNYDVYVRNVDDADATRVGEGEAQGFSPDGKSILAVVHGPPARVVVLPVGAGDPRPVATGNVTVMQARWLPDGKRLVLTGAEPGKGMRGYVQDLAGGAPRPITPEGITFNADQMALSHDGRRAAFRSPDGSITIYSTSGEPAVAAKGFAPGERPMGWTSDDRSLLIIEPDPDPRLVSVDPSTGHRETWKSLKPSDSAMQGPQDVVITPDGKSYVANWVRRQETLFLMDGLR